MVISVFSNQDGPLTYTNHLTPPVGSAATANSHTHQIDFIYHYRCDNPNADGICEVAPTAATAANFPDTPVDQFCGASYCENYAPTFYTTRALRWASAKVRGTDGVLQQSSAERFYTEWFDGDGTGSEPKRLWLRSIQHAGTAGGTTAWMPAIFIGSASNLPNRVQYNIAGGVTPIYYRRVTSIVDEYGSETRVAYTRTKPCTPADNPSGTWNDNTWSCFPRFWAGLPGGEPGPVPWHKYSVDSVIVVDQSGDEQASTMVWDYRYPDASATSGGMAWHSDTNPFVDSQHRYWGEYRGFERVQIVEGQANTEGRRITEYWYHRGMDGDINTHSSSPTLPNDVATTPSEDSSLPAVSDVERFRGRVRSVRVRDADSAPGNPGSQIYSASTTGYISWATAGTWNGTSRQSWQVEVSQILSRTVISGQGRYNTVNYAYDAHGWFRRLSTVRDYGRVNSAYANTVGDDGRADDLCTISQYSPSTPAGGRFLNGLPWRVSQYSSVASPSCDGATILTDTRTYYDSDSGYSNGAAPVAPTYGNPTAVWQATGGDVVDWTNTVVGAVVTQVQYGYNGWFGANASWGRVNATIDARGKTTTYAYVPHGTSAKGAKTITVTNPLGQATVTEFDLFGRQKRSTDANSRSGYVCYDPLGRVTRVYEPGVAGGATCTGSPSQMFAYQQPLVTPNSQPSGLTLPNVPRWAIQSRTLFALDADAYNPLATGDSYLESWSLFDGMGRIAQTNRPSPSGGRVVERTVYDSSGRVLWTSQPIYQSGASTGATWWLGGTAQVPRATRFTYDALGRPVATVSYSTTTVVRTQRTTYGSASVTIAPEAAGSGTATFASTVQHLDADGNVWKVTENTNNGANRDTLYRYDQRGRLVEIVDSGSNITAMRYNRLGWRVALDDPNAGYSTTRYDQNGNVNLTTDAAGVLIYRNYDDLNRLSGVHNGNWCADSVYTYDPTGGIGHLARAEAYAGCGTLQTATETTAFDTAGRPTTTVTTVDAAAGVASDALVGPFTTTVAYTRNGVPYRQTYPAVPGSNLPTAETVTTVFNSHGLPIQVGGYTELIEYDPYGRPIKTTMGPAGSQGGLVTQTVYSATDNRLARQVATTRAGQVLQDDTYTYDAPGNPTQIAHNTGVWGDETECFGYDQRQRLTIAFAVAGLTTCPTSAPGGAVYADTYSYDHLVRFTNFDGTPRTYNASSPTGCTSATNATKPHATAGFANADRTDTLAYNCYGAMTEQESDLLTGQFAGTTWTETHTYDRQQRLTNTDLTVTNTASGAELNSVDTTNVYDTTSNRVMRQDPDGTRTIYLGNTEIRYIPWFGVYIARTYGQTRREFDGTTTSLAVNHQGSIIAAASAAAVERIQYSPYGAPRTGTSVDDRNFLGHVDDPSSSAVHVENRYYSPGLGVFTSTDPVLAPGHPWAANPYAYGAANPAAFTDASGLFPIRIDPRRTSNGGETFSTLMGDIIHHIIEADFISRHPSYSAEVQYARPNASSGTMDLAETSSISAGQPTFLFNEIKPLASLSALKRQIRARQTHMDGQTQNQFFWIGSGGSYEGKYKAKPDTRRFAGYYVLGGWLRITAWRPTDQMGVTVAGAIVYEFAVLDPDKIPEDLYFLEQTLRGMPWDEIEDLYLTEFDPSPNNRRRESTGMPLEVLSAPIEPVPTVNWWTRIPSIGGAGGGRVLKQ